MIRVMVVDDHKMVREGLTRLIEYDEEIRVVDEAGMVWNVYIRFEVQNRMSFCWISICRR